MTARKWVMLAVVLALIGGTALSLQQARRRMRLGQPGLRMLAAPVFCEDGQVVNTNTVDLPVKVLQFESKPTPIRRVELGWLPADTTYARRLYEAPDKFWVMLGVVMMGLDRGSIHKPQICLTGQGWTIEKSDLLQIPITRPHRYDLPVMRLTARQQVTTKSGRTMNLKAIYVYWFVADGELTARHGERMWWMARDLFLTGTLPRWAYVSYLSVCLPGQEEVTYQRMREFIAASVPEYQLATRPPGPEVKGPARLPMTAGESAGAGQGGQ